MITTAAWAIGENETICYAHKHGARVVTAYAMGLYGGGNAHETYLQLMFNKTARAASIIFTAASGMARSNSLKNTVRNLSGRGRD